ncbi:MAG: carotenoid 1,2-hydratase [Bacteroidetes bacterium]|nr:carotenoid 1,2-hydratase [Bacteroidota bacterium]
MEKIFIIILIITVFSGCGDTKKETVDSGISLSKTMGNTENSGEDFEKAIERKKFVFPADHGPHPGFRTEWWYFTGNLTSSDNKKFGYQFTIFRTALSRDTNKGTSEWRSDQIYMAHFAVTDITGERFYFDERFSRDGNKLAGAQASPFRVWLENWEISKTGSGVSFGLPVISINAETEKTGINLIIEALKPAVLQGDSGLSQKGKGAGNASYYYSYTRMKTEGKLIIEGKESEVSGFSWMDREWSTSALGEDQKGWDWFALQLDDNTEIMYYQMRKNDGTPDVYSKGTLIDRDGSSQIINKEEVIPEITGYWQSPSGEKYPSGWILKIPSRNIELKITPSAKDQLMNVSIRYWEGSVLIEGTKDGKEISGRGYVELTGY